MEDFMELQKSTLTRYEELTRRIDNSLYLDFVEDVYLHKIIVMKCALYLAKYLLDTGIEEERDAAHILIKNTLYHDNSKLEESELEGFVSIQDDTSCLGNKEASLGAKKESIIQIHWKNNIHHPEHYKNVIQMPLAAQLEMVCDHAARSIQFHNSLIEFVTYRQKHRFQLPLEMFNSLLKYYHIMDDYVQDYQIQEDYL